MNDSLASTLVLCDLDNLLLGEDGNLTQVVRTFYSCSAAAAAD